jgi:hypothetical protein
MVAPFGHFLHLDYKTGWNTAETACDPAVFPIAEPLAAQDFGRERDVVG